MYIQIEILGFLKYTWRINELYFQIDNFDISKLRLDQVVSEF